MDPFTGLSGVGLLITPTCPVRDLRDVPLSHASSLDICSHYLLVQGFVNSVATYIHTVYAPVQPGQWPQFFNNFLVALMMVLITLLWEISILYNSVNSTKLVRNTAIAAMARRITRLDE